MSNLPNTSRTQTEFLRAFRKYPDGPPPSKWPTPSVLRRWLRRPGFRRALATLRHALTTQHRLKLLLIAPNADTAISAGITNTPMPTPPAGNATEKPGDESCETSNDQVKKAKQPPPPVTEFQRRLCNDLLRAIRPRATRRNRPIIISPPKFDDCLAFLERQLPHLRLDDALILYRDEYAKAQEEERERLLRERPSLCKRLLEQETA